MADSPSFDRLLSGVHKGDGDQVGDIIVRRYAARLAGLAAARISAKLRRKVEADDVVQSAFRTFFRRLDDGKLELRDWDSVWGLLARIVVRRIAREAERSAALKRSGDRETAMAEAPQAFDREPKAEEVAQAVDLIEQLIGRMPEKYRAIVQQILAEHSHEEIAQAQGTSISTVERVHRRARELLAKLDPEEF